MIGFDFVLGAAVGIGSSYVAYRVKSGVAPVPGQSPLTFVEHVLEGFKQIMTDAAQSILGKIDALEASIGAKFSAQVADLQAQLDAEKQAHADDLAQITAKLDAAQTPAG